MFTTRPCGCKGQRTCLICESQFSLKVEEKDIRKDGKPSYVFCPRCARSWPGWNAEAKHLSEEHVERHNGIENSIHYPTGIYVQEDFISEDEERIVMKALDAMPWDLSQSGRRKQNFGPKTNFRKKIMKVGHFHGFPSTTKLVQDKFKAIPILQDFITIEQCSLEYDPSRGASIDPHIDDCWVWGERVVTVNLLGDSVLTLTPYKGDKGRYNLQLAPEPSLWEPCEPNSVPCTGFGSGSGIALREEDVIVRVPMPRRSLIVLTGAARYRWLHSVLRSDVKERRVCLAYRELTSPYLPGGDKWAEAKDILEEATRFWEPTPI